MTNPLRILIVEDSADDAEVTVLELSRDRLAPDWKRVESADEMRAALAERPWDAVLSDFTLPGFSAAEALALCRKTDPDLPFIVVSGTIGEQRAVEMMRAGAGDYLLKGNLNRLSAAVEREVREAGNRRNQKRAEAAMRASETRYRRLFEAARDGILIVDPQSRKILDANPFLTELLGYSREELVGKELWEIGLFQDIEANKAAFRTLQEQGYIRYKDLPLKSKDGRPIQVEFVSNTYDAGDARVIQCNIRDITGRIKSEESIRTNEARFRAVVDSNMLATFFWRERGLVTECNDAFLAMIGYTQDDVAAGRVSWVDMTPPECNLRDMNALAEIARSGRCAPYEKEYIRKDGSRVPILLGAAGLDGDMHGVAFAIDLTERKHAESILRERAAHAVLSADIGMASTGGSSLQQALQICVESMVRNLNAAFARIWMLNEATDTLELRTSAGMYTHLDGPHGRVPVGQYKIGLIAKEKKPHISNNVVHDPRVGDPEWAKREGMIAFAGYPLIANERLVGVIAMFARERLTEAALSAIGTVAHQISSVIVRQEKEVALHTSEERYRTLITATTSIVWDSPASGEFNTEQPAWTAFTGQTVDQHRGYGWLDVIHPDDREKSAVAWAAAVENRTDYRMEHRLRRADGVYRHMTVRAVPILEPDGSIREWVGVHTDVTEQHRAEADLLLRDRAIRAASQGIVITDSDQPDNPIIYVSPGFDRMTGYDSGEVLGQNCRFLQGKDTDPATVAQVREAILAGNPCTVEFLNYRKDGTPFWNELSMSPVRDEAGRLTHFVGVQVDATARRSLQEEFRKAKQRLEHVVASSPGVLFTLSVVADRIQGVTWMSDNLLDVLGYPSSAAFSPDWWQNNLHPNDRDRIPESHSQLFQQGRSNLEYRFRHMDGGYRWMRDEQRLVRNAVKQYVEVVGSLTDITERKSLEDQFHQTQKMEAFGQLAGGVAHDFNNLLTIINGYSEMLLRSLPQSDPSRDLVDEIHKAGERSAGLTRQLLAFSRQQLLAPRILNLNEVVADTDKMLHRLIGEDVLLTTTLQSEPWAVRADPGQIEQVLLNLAVNARDVMPKGGRLTIETRNIDLDESYVRTHKDAHAGPHVLLSMTDTGSGMPPAVMAKIFEPFFTTKEPGKGTGLGLATVYGIVKQSDGHLTVDSEVGIGTTFKIYLPRVEHASNVFNAPSRVLPLSRGTETILLVEDEDGVRAFIRHILNSCGYSVLEAAEGNEANRVAAKHTGPIHLLITDVVMPGAGGLVVAEHVAERFPEIRVIYVSGYTDDAVIRHGVLRDEVNFIQKPFTPTALARKVREVLDSPAGLASSPRSKEVP